MITTTHAELVARIDRLSAAARVDQDRVIIGIVGAPGSGKSTLASALVDRLGDRSALVGMDGFHLGQTQLDRLGRADRKGAPDTFDPLGYRALLQRIRDQPDLDHFVPVFDRHLEQPIAAEGWVPAGVPVVITEGNYLLLDDPSWRDLADLLDETWFLDPKTEVRVDRLIKRHVAHGRTLAAARAWVQTVDEPNARLIERSASRATLRLPWW